MIKVNVGNKLESLDFLKSQSLMEPDSELSSYEMNKLKTILDSSFLNKCAYCETVLNKDLNIDHYRPIDGARNQDGTISKNYYWWLRYRWDNLLLVCKGCNVNKNNRFPVESSRVPFNTVDSQNLAQEQPLLINPTQENPEELFLYTPDGYIYTKDKRAQVTIDILGLNRFELIDRRASSYKNLQYYWSLIIESFNRIKNFNTGIENRLVLAEAISRVKHEIKANAEFSGLKRYFIRAWVALDTDLRMYILNSEPSFEGIFSSRINISLEHSNDDFEVFKRMEKLYDDFDIKNVVDRVKYFSKRRYIERIKIKNFRTIKELDIRINLGTSKKYSAPWLMLLGDNGTGKSTILQAIALTLMDKESRSNYIKNASSLLTAEATEGFVKVYLSGSYEPITLSFNKGDKQFTGENNDNQKVILLGYGSTRLLPKSTSRRVEQFGVLRVENLFNSLHLLTNASKQLYSLREEVFDVLQPALESLLMLEKDSIRRDLFKKNRINVHYRNQYPVSLDELSDGYRSMMALGVDILMALVHLGWNHKDGEAIILIDELDAHLHPKWILQIVERFRYTFPNIQFIVTSHDPLCLRGMDQNEIVVLRKDHSNEVFVEKDLPPQEELEVDTLLKSQFFGLNYTLDPKVNAEFNEYYRLLASSNLTNGDEEQLRSLREKLINNNQLGKTPREQMMYQIIDEYMAKLQYNPLKQLTHIKEETKQKVIEILTSVEGMGRNSNDSY